MGEYVVSGCKYDTKACTQNKNNNKKLKRGIIFCKVLYSFFKWHYINRDCFCVLFWGGRHNIMYCRNALDKCENGDVFGCRLRQINQQW